MMDDFIYGEPQPSTELEPRQSLGNYRQGHCHGAATDTKLQGQ